MNYLLNMNVPRSLGEKLEDEGHQCRHVGDIGLGQADDVEIVAEARDKQSVIITHDLDYGDLLAFSGATSPSVIIFRVRNAHPQHLFDRLQQNWRDIDQALKDGSIVLIEDSAIRIRRLPVVEDC